MSHILLTGAKGMLGSCFQTSQTLEHAGHTVSYTDHQELDICNDASVEQYIVGQKIDLIINCAAYTAVDQAQTDPLNFQINTMGTINLAYISAKYHVPLLAISTDYVFDGTQTDGYMPESQTHPCNHYGLSKSLGEQAVLQICKDAKIVRTSRLYGGGAGYKNFVNTMVSLSQHKKELSVVNDQRGAPTYTDDLVQAITSLVGQRNQHNSRIFHFCNQAPEAGITRYTFAQAIFKHLESDIVLRPILTSGYPTPAPRPAHSHLLNPSTIQLPGRKSSLIAYLDTHFNS